MPWNWQLPHWPKFSYDPDRISQLERQFLLGVGSASANYIAITKTTRATATRDLADLVKKNALVKTGELRHTRYRLNIASLISAK